MLCRSNLGFVDCRSAVDRPSRPHITFDPASDRVSKEEQKATINQPVRINLHAIRERLPLDN
jgi:hypothetical protein